MPTVENPRHQLLDAVSGHVRKSLIRERARAMSGRLADALISLAELARHHSSAEDRVAIGMLRAELLDADQQHELAQKVFDDEVRPERGAVLEYHRATIDRNAVTLRSNTFRHVADFYHLVDRERVQGVQWLDYGSLFSALRDRADNKRYKSLPIIWRQLQDAYRSGSWFAQQVASGLFIEECLASKEPALATLHLLLARDEESIPLIVEAVNNSHSVQAVRDVLHRIFTSANLKTHTALGCQLLNQLSDVIPDDELPRVADWLYPLAALESYSVFGSNPLIHAWKAVSWIAERLDIEHGRKWIDMLLNHPMWKARVEDSSRFVRGREELIEAALPLVWVVRSDPTRMARIAHETLDLLANCRQTSEYYKSLNLLCCLAKWGGDDLKEWIASALYIPDQPVTYALVGAAHHFGKDERFTASKLEPMAKEVAKQIRLQVQRPQPGEQAVPPSSHTMVASNIVPGSQPTIYLVSITDLAALASHRKSLSQESLAEVLRAAVQLASDRDNFLANRQHLLQQIKEFSDQVDSALRLEIINGLEPLARGPIAESEHYSKAADARNPLNPFKFQMGDPEDVQAAAMVTFTAYAALDESLRGRIAEVLSPQFFDASARIRAGACEAASLCDQIDQDTLAAVISALRDPNPEVVSTAFTAIERQPEWHLNPMQRRMLLLAIRFAADSNSAVTRRRAAKALQAVATRSRAFLRNDVQELLNLFRNDWSYSVRCVIDLKRC
jgi:hypothetical protein